jgi:hypothetical protein
VFEITGHVEHDRLHSTSLYRSVWLSINPEHVNLNYWCDWQPHVREHHDHARPYRS